MLSFRKTLCIIFFTTFTYHGYAQQQAVGLKNLLNLAMQHAPAIQADSSAILIRQAEARETRSKWLPSLKVNYQTDIGSNNNLSGPYFSFGVVPSNSRGVRPESNTDPALSSLGVAALDWEVYNFGAYQAENRVAESAIDVEKNSFLKSKYELQSYIIGNYFVLMHLMDRSSIQEKNIKRNEDIYRSIKSLAKSGVKAGVDTSIAAAELSKARLTYIELANQSKSVQLQLSALTGLPYQSILPDTTYESKLISGLPVQASSAMDTLAHPFVALYASMYANSKEKETLISKSYLPKVFLEGAVWGRGSSINANDYYAPLDRGMNFARSNYLIGVGIGYNLFDIKKRSLKLSTQKNFSDYSKKKLREEKEQLALSNQQADLRLQTAAERLHEIPNQLAAAESAYRQKLSLYKNGLTNIVELNNALSILYRAEIDLTVAKYDYCKAAFEKAAAENAINPFLNLLN